MWGQKLITPGMIMRLGPCWSRDRVYGALPEPVPLVDFFRRADIPPVDRLWVACHDGVLPPTVARIFACDVWERSMDHEDETIARVIESVRQWVANGQDPEELDQIETDTVALAEELDYPGIWATACLVGPSAADAAYDIADEAACRVPRSARKVERLWQVTHLANLLEGGM